MFQEITDFIFVQDEPEMADAVVIPGNIYPQPALRAARLYKEGYADLFYASGRFSKGLSGFPGPEISDASTDHPDRFQDGAHTYSERLDGDFYEKHYATEADMIRDILLRSGVPDKMIRCDREATFTYENALNIKAMMDQEGIFPEKVIICCQAHHARRCKMYFEYVFRDRNVHFLVCPVSTQGISRVNWMESKKGLELVFGELRRCGEQFGMMLAGQDV